MQAADISADASPPNAPLFATAVSWLHGFACATAVVDTIHPAVRAAPHSTPSIFFFMVRLSRPSAVGGPVTADSDTVIARAQVGRASTSLLFLLPLDCRPLRDSFL